MSVTNFSNANIAIYKLQSTGSNYDITIPFEADCIEWWNETKYATNSQNLQGIWFPGLADPIGGALVIARGTTDLTSTLETSTGITELDDGSGFESQVKTPTAIDKSVSCTVTIAAHGWVDGNWVRASNFVTSPVASATGMEQLNYRQFVIGNVTTNTFDLFDTATGLPIDSTNYTTFVNNGIAKFTRIGQDLNTQSAAPVYQYTLGASIMANSGDVIFVRAMKANVATDLGIV